MSEDGGLIGYGMATAVYAVLALGRIPAMLPAVLWPGRRGAAGERRELSLAIRAAARMAPVGARMRQVITQPA